MYTTKGRPKAVSTGWKAGSRLAQSDNSSNSTENAGGVANRQTIRWNVSRYHAARAYGAVASNGDAGKNYRVRANPYIIFNDNWCGRRRHISFFDAMLVFIQDANVMSQQTVAPYSNLLVCCNRRAVVDERMIAYRNIGALDRDNFDRDNVSYQANTNSKFYVTARSEADATKKSDRQWQSGLAAHTELSIEKCCSQTWVAEHFKNLANGRR